MGSSCLSCSGDGREKGKGRRERRRGYEKEKWREMRKKEKR